MKTFRIAAAAFLAAVAFPALAQPPAPPAPQQGGPGGAPQGDITRAQAEQIVRDQIGRLDMNHDGVVTDKEVEAIIDRIATAGGPERMGDRLHQLVKDYGKDGRLVIDDLVKARLAQFDAADTNHDGKLDPAERQAAMAAARAGREGGAAPR
ncbi:MAG TPA: hypothetical protein VGC56_01035 [Allosphingosinicella sp.]|jgi:hypothetical protein